jgi:jasmonate ZIM domain-containing protein
MPGTDVGADEK